MDLHEELTSRLYEYLQPACTAAGLTDMIFDYENGVTPQGSFAAADIRRVEEAGAPEVLYKREGGGQDEEHVNYRGTVVIGLDIYAATNAIFIAEQIKVNLARNSAQERAIIQNLGLQGTGDTLSLPYAEKGKYRQRAQFEVRVGFAFTYTEDDTTIGQVTVKGTLDTLTVEETITE